MNVLLLGSGGRECAFARSLSASPLCTNLFIAPGNPGTEYFGKNLDVSLNDFAGIARLVRLNQIELLVVGPEEPLVLGLRDYFQSEPDLKNVLFLGPGKDGAQLEGSKDFSKAFMKRHQIPTADYLTVRLANEEEGLAFLKKMRAPYVLKADGLAAGKGVLILDDAEEAEKELKSILYGGKFGKAGEKVVIEEFLKGIEVSVFVLCDGKDYLILPEAKDYKRIGAGDTGLNTGGMGAVSPVPFADSSFMKKVEERIVVPTIQGLKEEGIEYRGFIFIGLMKVGDDPFVIEYNCRMGDPETEVVLPRIKSDFVELIRAAASGKISGYTLEVDQRYAATVVMVSGGYPGNYEKGFVIRGLDRVQDTLVFHAGTSGKLPEVVSSGGRVLALTSLDEKLEHALQKSYTAAKTIQFDYAYYRNDIGRDLM